MATPPDAPPSSTDGKLPNPVLVEKQPGIDGLKIEAIKESSPSLFVNSEPIREEQVQNAVKFLSHSKVRGSPVIYRRSFLEKKGLTKEEIDEAFRRVPDPTPAVTTTKHAITDQGGQMNSSSNFQQNVPVPIMHPTQVVPGGTISKRSAFSQFHWFHALVAVGFLAFSGAGSVVLFKRTIIPRLKSWVRKVVNEDEEEDMVKKSNAKPSVAEEVAAAAKAAAMAAAEVARASQEMMKSKDEEKRCYEELVNMLNKQVLEMKSMSKVIQKIEGQSTTNVKIGWEEQNDRWENIISKQPHVNGKADADSRSVRSVSVPVLPEPVSVPVPVPVPVQPSVAPHPKTYMEILDMIQRGEKPSNIREINDAPPNPNQPISNPRLVPKPKPWEVNQAYNSTTAVQVRSSGSSYDESLDKLSNVENPGRSSQQNSVRITEIEDDDEKKLGSPYVLGSERPVQKSWVPPQPPPVAMPGAAAAIRLPKKSSVHKEQLTDDQLLARSPNVSNEMPKISRITELDDTLESNGKSSSLNSSEIRREEDGSYPEP